MTSGPEPTVAPSKKARAAVAATVFAAVLAYGLLVPADSSPGVVVTAALVALVCQMGFVSWYEQLPTRDELQPFWRVIAFALAAGGGFLLYCAVVDEEVSRPDIAFGAALAVVAIALGLADRWVWLRRYRPS